MTVSRWRLAGSLAVAACLWTSPAQAGVAHTVRPGETMWSIAAASNLTTRTLAAANGLAETSPVVVGSTITVPSVSEGAAALAGSGAAPASSGAPPPAGAYTVRPGDTLSGIAARAGVSPAAVAAMNGLAADAQVISGTALKLPTGSAGTGSVAASSGSTVPAAPAAAPQATQGRVGASEIGQIASQNGVPSSLAAAVAWQESGFNNAKVSSANARGVMQVMPGTWSWVQDNLAGRRLDPASAQDNIHAGTLYLNQLLRDSGGDPATAIAGYYQGAASVKSIGMLPETRRYVDDVLALRSRFGG